MGFIILAIVTFLLGAGLFGGGKALAAFGDREGKAGNGNEPAIIGRIIQWSGAALFGLAMLIGIPANSLHQVQAGEVGVVYTFGEITGQRAEGFQFTWPWQEIATGNVQVQTLAFMDHETFDKMENKDDVTLVGDGLDSFSEETQNVYIDVVLRIKVSPENIQALYREVGPNYINKLIPGSIAQVFKDETVSYKAVDIAPNRELIRANVERAIEGELSRFSIDIDALLLHNIYFDKSFEDAILAKQNATQEALKEQELVAAETSRAAQVAAKALGESQRLITTAEGQAKANTLVNGSLTPLLVQFQAIQKMADDIKIMLLPADQNLFFDPATILGQKPAAP